MIRFIHMIDTKIPNLSQREKKIISFFLQKQEMRSSDVFDEVVRAGENISLVTIKRALSGMVKKGVLRVSGSGRATNYRISTVGRLFSEIDARAYISVEPDKRYGLHGYNFELFPEFPSEVFTNDELKILDKATNDYRQKASEVSPVIQKKELERLVIELSWKSSKIEGNTYTLLDTENLILKNKPATGKTKEETQMILNHKDAFCFVYENRNIFKTLTKQNLERLHSIIVKDLSVNLGLRKNPVGISGSIYRPLDNVYQISEAVEVLSGAINRIASPYAKSVTALLGTSYVQPFEDGNKRTSRLMADALLLAHGCAPLSYRSVDENEYWEAKLVFYELNSITPFKKMFIEQYEFAAKNYTIK